MNWSVVRSLPTYGLVFSVLEIFRRIKVITFFGTFSASFSLFHALCPLAGSLGGPLIPSIALCTKFLWQLPHIYTLKTLALTVPLPTLCSLIFWHALRNSKNKMMAALIPAASILLFIAHPVGNHVAWYSALWILPLYVLQTRRSLFMQALATTLTAHAVGTVLWIYCVPTTASFWIALFPLVLLERFTYAVTLSAAYTALVNTQAFLGTYKIFQFIRS